MLVEYEFCFRVFSEEGGFKESSIVFPDKFVVCVCNDLLAGKLIGRVGGQVRMTVDEVISCPGCLVPHSIIPRCMTVDTPLICYPGCLLEDAASIHCTTVL